MKMVVLHCQWLIQSVILGIPQMLPVMVAHPTGTMGSMGLNNVEGFISKQALRW